MEHETFIAFAYRQISPPNIGVKTILKSLEPNNVINWAR